MNYIASYVAFALLYIFLYVLLSGILINVCYMMPFNAPYPELFGMTIFILGLVLTSIQTKSSVAIKLNEKASFGYAFTQSYNRLINQALVLYKFYTKK